MSELEKKLEAVTEKLTIAQTAVSTKDVELTALQNNLKELEELRELKEVRSLVSVFIIVFGLRKYS